jgi:hypothetical protein
MGLGYGVQPEPNFALPQLFARLEPKQRAGFYQSLYADEKMSASNGA